MKNICAFCGGSFDTAAQLSLHRALSGELRDTRNREAIMNYRRGHTLWQTLVHFQISQESYRAVEGGRETVGHHKGGNMGENVLRKRLQEIGFGHQGERSRWLQEHAGAILADYRSMGTIRTCQKWHLGHGTLSRMRQRASPGVGGRGEGAGGGGRRWA